MMKTLVAAFLHTLSFHYCYKSYINPAFEYAGYTYFPPETWALFSCYVLSVLPILAHRRSAAPAHVGASIIYTLCYVPAQVILMCMWQRDLVELIQGQAALSVSMLFIFRAARAAFKPGPVPIYPDRISTLALCMTVMAIAVALFIYRNHMQFVSFENVYDLRSETADLGLGAFSDYLLSWLAYALIPFHLARALVQRKRTELLASLAACIVIYTATGSKAVILMPMIMMGIRAALKRPEDILRTLLAYVGVTILLMVLLLPDEGLLFWIKSILLVRILGTSGWTVSVYYEFFSTHDFTYYTHIGPVRAIFGGYPYGEMSLGQMIAIEYTGTDLANFNANFWASDAFAAMGVVGVPVVTAAVCFVFVLLNWAASKYDSRFVSLWLSGFWLALLNLPLTTALLSGGGLVAIGLLILDRRLLRAQERAGADVRRDLQSPGARGVMPDAIETPHP